MLNCYEIWIKNVTLVLITSNYNYLNTTAAMKHSYTHDKLTIIKSMQYYSYMA